MKNNYTVSMPPLYRWYALFLVFMMSTWLPVMGQSKLANHGTYQQTLTGYASLGAGGWSAPSGVILGGGFQHNGGSTVYASFPAQPSTAYPHYTYGANEYGWNVYNGPDAGSITIHGIYSNMPPGYGILTQTISGFGPGGWAGWSVPAGKVILGGGFEANGPVAVSAPAGPNTVWPHYTYGANEYGWVVRSAGATSITIHAIYADMPEGYEIVKSPVMNFGSTGWAGWSVAGVGKVITGGGFQLPGAAIASRPGLPNQTTPFGYTYGSNEYGWLVQNGSTPGDGYIYAIYANRELFPVKVFASDGTTLKSDHNTIQAAINAASAGDVVEVGAGTYTENIIVNKANLTVRAIGAVTINDVATPASWSGWSGANMPGRDPVVFIKANGVTFEGFNIRDYKQKTGSPYVFSVVRVEGDNVTVKGLNMQSQYDANYLASASYELIVVAKGNNVVVRDNVLQRTKQNTLGTAIIKIEREIAPGDIVGNVLLKNNTVNGGPVAVRLNPNATITVEDNTLSNVNFEGLWVALQPGASTSGHLVFTNNTVSNFNVTCGTCRAIKVAAKPASINGQANSGSMLSAVQAANTGVSSWLFEWMGPVCNVTQDLYYTTIQAAVNAATAGDIITVAAGTYNEAVLLNKAVSLRGANYGIAAGNQPGTRAAESIVVGGFNITSAATVNGFTVRTGFAFAGTGGVGIAVAYPGVTITNTIIENVVTANSYGLTTSLMSFNPLNNLTFTNNTVRNNYMGMYLNPGVGHVFTGNLIDNNSGLGIGIGSDGLSNFTFTGNTVSNHTLEGWGISSVGANVVANNNIFLGKGIFHYGGQTIDATCNWWGQATGPAVGQNDGNITTTPYLLTSNLNGACIGGFTVQNITQSTWYGSIQSAVNAANAGDVIEAGAATYNETVSIEKALTVRGPNHAIAGSGTRAAEAIVTGGFVMNGVSNVTISGFSVTGSNVAGSRGILLGNTSTVAGPITLSNNIIENWTTSISLAGGATYPWVSSVTVSGNLIRNNTAGIGSTENVAGLTVSNNTFSGNAEGIGLGPGLTGLSVTGNTFASTNSSHIADYGSGTMPAYASLFAGNTFGNAAAVSATNGNDYTTQSIYNTIGSAVSNAAVGATITVTAGTYNENITINKRLTLDGAGSGTVGSTIVTAAVPNLPTFYITAGGLDASNRQILKDLRITGATGGNGNPNSGIRMEPGVEANGLSFVTFDNIACVDNTGHGFVFNASNSFGNDLRIIASAFVGNGNAGISLKGGVALDGFVLENSIVSDNANYGLVVNDTGNDTYGGTNFQITGTNFYRNGASGLNSASRFGNVNIGRFNGNLAVSYVTIDGQSVGADHGFSIGGRNATAAAGTMSFTNLTILGDFVRPALATVNAAGQGRAFSIKGYSDVSNVTFVGVQLNNTTGNSMEVMGINGTLNIGNTIFGEPSAGLIGSGTAPTGENDGTRKMYSIVTRVTTSNPTGTSPINATGATFNYLSAATLSDAFSIADRVLDAVDDGARGHVRIKSGEVFVTPNSYDLATTSPSIQRSVNAATAGDIVNVAAGTYTEAVTINKSLTLLGAQAGQLVTGRIAGGAAESVIAPSNGYGIRLNAGAIGVVIDGFSINGAAAGSYQGIEEYSSLTGTTIRNNFVYGFASTLGVSVATGSSGFAVEKNELFGNYAGIYLSTNAGSGTVTNNIIRNHVGGGFDQGAAVVFEGNHTDVTVSQNVIQDNGKGVYIWTGAGGENLVNVSVTNNSFTGNTALIINNRAPSVVLNATCNWYGSTNANIIASQISGSVTYSPWLNSGADGPAIGFQPSGACSGTAPTIASTVTNVSCFGLPNGAIDITVSGGQVPYTYAWNGGSTDEDRNGLIAGTYTVTVTDANNSTVSATITVTQPAAPVSSGAILGDTLECIAGVAGQFEFSLSPPATTATIHTWSWSGSSGVTLTNNGGTTITFNYTTAAIQAGITGTLTVTPSDVCGNNGPSSSVTIEFQAAAPVTPPSISGNSKLCPGDIITCSILAVDRATSYTWTAPTNTNVSSGAGTNVIGLTVNSGYNGGTLSVTASNICGSSPARTKSLVTNLPSTPSAISGLVNGQCNASGVTYSIAAVSGATSYSWSVSTSASIIGSSNGTSVSVNWPASGSTGIISVSSNNACGSSALRSLTVSYLPSRPDAITGINNPACVNSSDTISTNSVSGATSYTWGVTSGTGSGYSISGSTKTAMVTWGGTPANSQAITVRASNACGNSLTRQATGISVVNSGPACGSRMADASVQSMQLLVYPNPAHEVLNVNFSSDTEQRYQIRITDMSGRAVMAQDGMSDAGINMVQLTPASISTGVYLMQLTIGDQQAVQRIVIE